MQDLTKIVDMVTKCNWLLLILVAMVSVMITGTSFYLGVVAGGLIVAINFHLLKRTIQKDIRPEKVMEKGRSLTGRVLIKYYIRFVVSGMLIFLLISNHVVHPLGLLTGLSVVVASVFLVTVLVVTRLYFKEAV
ncbi:MAG: ATP synthase subunit I [Desulfotignum sp.]|nr:ATP synthase subunit I [Desulfotignum sp.]MCF8087904.1 ATP synthase subunit I [Desulfotignum sp.]